MTTFSGTIKAICISEKKGTIKHPIDHARFITEHGIQGDAHAGNWHRQVSFLAWEEIESFRRHGGNVKIGDFGENIVASGIPFDTLPVGTRLKAGEVYFEITQIGKKCHNHCEIFKRVGDCIMPRKGVFGRVLHGGEIKAGDKLVVTTEKLPLEAAIITASDKGAQGEREDKSGDKAEAMLKAAGYTTVYRTILPDEQSALSTKMREFADQGVSFILTTGGTGFSPRDVTPEATIDVCERLVPGIAEAMRSLSLKITSRAMLSRATSGIYKRSLIVNLPGSPKAVAECLAFILPSLSHGLDILRGETSECARHDKPKLNHFDAAGQAHMVDVSAKAETARQAVATGRINVSPEVYEAIIQGTAKKGDVLGTARLAGIMAAKKTADLIPLCHPLPLTGCNVDFTLIPTEYAVQATATTKITSRTGVEMEALCAVSTALLTIYDMCKALDKSMEITDIHLLEKTGGKSGHYIR